VFSQITTLMLYETFMAWGTTLAGSKEFFLKRNSTKEDKDDDGEDQG